MPWCSCRQLLRYVFSRAKAQRVAMWCRSRCAMLRAELRCGMGLSCCGHKKGGNMVKGIFHININVSNFERSLAFYKRLGFRVVRDLGEGGNKAFERGLQLANPVGRAALLMLGDHKYATRIDLIEWKSPKAEGKPY